MTTCQTLAVGSRAGRAVVPAGVVGEIIVVELSDLGAGQSAKGSVQWAAEDLLRSRERTGGHGIGQALLNDLEREAGKVIALEKIICVVDATGEAGEVDTLVGVDAVGVTTEAERVGVCGVLEAKISKDTGHGLVLLRRGAAVPVL